MDKPKRLIGLNQKVSSLVREASLPPDANSALPVYRANLNHPVNATEHGNAANPVRPRDRTDFTARRVRGRSIGMTEKERKQRTVGQPTEASITPPPLTWKAIDWHRVRQEVRRLQMRIAKATQA